MPLLLPNLDDRIWSDLVREGTSLIPLYAPQWTDHNVHDPGITLMELFAWIAEMDIYRLNRVPEAHRLKFLALVGIHPKPPEPAQVVLSLTPKSDIGGNSTLAIPVGTEFEGNDPFASAVLFRTLDKIIIVSSTLEAVQVKEAQGFFDQTNRWQRGEAVAALGEDPQPGAALYLGFMAALPKNVSVSLFFVFDDSKSGEQERNRILQENTQCNECRRPLNKPIRGDDVAPPGNQVDMEEISPHHSASTSWEFFNNKQQWQPLYPELEQVEDDTRALTLDGRVLLRMPDDMAKTRIGRVDRELFYVRCRFVAGAYDIAPRLQTVVLNGVQAEQATPPKKFLTWVIAEEAVVLGREPAPGELTSFNLELDEQQEIVRLVFESDSENLPTFLVLDYRKPSTATPGVLSIEAELLGLGTERPHQQLRFSERPIEQTSCALFTLEEDGWRHWTQRPDFHASGRSDAHFLLDTTEGLVTVGDGEKGRVVPRNAPFISRCNVTRAEAGNLNEDRVERLADTPHNRAVLADFDATKDQLDSVTNPLLAVGGEPAENLEQAIGRALQLKRKSTRAVNVADYEILANETPGVHLARAFAQANLHPSFPCLEATGIITLIILPFLPKERPLPSRGLCHAVSKYLNRHRIIGTRVEVIAPSYLEIAVQAEVKACAGTDKAAIKGEIITALDNFFHPLTGGAERKGWPFGRDIYRSEVLEIIDRTPGVDHVLSLDLIANGEDPQCGNVCIDPFGLVVTGEHRIRII